MLKLDEGHMNEIHVPMVNQQDLIKCFYSYKLQFNGYLYKQKHGSHINIFKKDKINDSSRLFILFYLWKTPCIEKLFILEILLTLKKYLYWKIICIEKLISLNFFQYIKISCIEKLISFKKLLTLKN